ncbi:MAG: hypothetical protein HY913_04305 [Desulfomonile tiedjei]|nr:hypothetical protein [Desulfomonile tiedjei]
MADFLGASRDLVAKGQAGDSKESFENVFKAIGILQGVHSKCDVDLNNVESVFTAFEMARTLGGLPGYGIRKMDRLIQDMKVLISRTIEQTLLFPMQNSVIGHPPPYGLFSDMVKYLQESAKPSHNVAVLTFNYDLALDRSLAAKGLKPDYCLEDGKNPDGLPLLKLHGSLNWAYCPECRRVFSLNLLSKKAEDFFEDKVLPRHGNSAPMPIQRWLDEESFCPHTYSKQPLIVPPTWNKASYHRVMPTVWHWAAHYLRSAEYIFVLGYSFPSSDTFFHHLYGLGSLSQTPLRRFWVCNPDRELVRGRFENLLGPGARRVFAYHESEFRQAIDEVWDSFRPPR